jgi:peptidoglycan-N-acetylglucosamine deacetylase
MFLGNSSQSTAADSNQAVRNPNLQKEHQNGEDHFHRGVMAVSSRKMASSVAGAADCTAIPIIENAGMIPSGSWGYEMLFFGVGLVFVALGLVVFWIQPLAVLPVLERITPNLEYRVRTDLPLVALSFDDGPHPVFTPRVLEILQRHDARATFFLIGERALRHPDLVARVKAEGHEIGNHYFRDGPMLAHSDADFLRYLEETERAVGLLEGPKLFRAPGGVASSRQLTLARQQGYTPVLGCAYPHDPMHPPVWYIRWLIEKNLRPGTIVILHDGITNPTRSIEALPHILAAGRQRGLRFVSISELRRSAA